MPQHVHPSRSGRNYSYIDNVDGDLAFWIALLFILFLLYMIWRWSRTSKDEERRAKLLKLKRKILRRKEE